MKNEKLIIDLIKDVNLKLDKIAETVENMDKKIDKIFNNLNLIK